MGPGQAPPPTGLDAEHQHGTADRLQGEDQVRGPSRQAEALEEPGGSGERVDQQLEDQAVGDEHGAQGHPEQEGGEIGAAKVAVEHGSLLRCRCILIYASASVRKLDAPASGARLAAWPTESRPTPSCAPGHAW